MTTLEEMLKKVQYMAGGLERMVGGTTMPSPVQSVQSPIQALQKPTVPGPALDWAKPGPRMSKLSPVTPGYQEVMRHQIATGQIQPPQFQPKKLDPNESLHDLRLRLQKKQFKPREYSIGGAKASPFLYGDINQPRFEDKPGYSGFVNAALLGIPARLSPEAFEEIKRRNETAFNIGKIPISKYGVGSTLGSLVKYGMGYTAAGPTIAGMKGWQAIQNPFMRTMAVELAKDVAIGTPIGITESLIEGKKPKEIAKALPKQLAQDALANLAFYGAGKAMGGIKKLKEAKIDEAIPDSNWAKSVTMPDGTPLKSMEETILEAHLTPEELDILKKVAPMKEMEAPVVDRVFDRQYNDIESIKAQLSKYYSGFDDYAHKEALDYAAEAIQDLQKTESNILSGDRRGFSLARGSTESVLPSGEWPGAGKTIGYNVSQNLIDTGKVNLTGIEFNDINELATIAQVYRGPRFETFRIIYAKGNTIVGTDAVSSRMPSITSVFVEKPENTFRDMKRRMASFGADKYYLLHNHPSGSMSPSQPDLDVTKFFANNVPGFHRHIIINSGKYTEIAPILGINNNVIDLHSIEGVRLSLGVDRLKQPSMPHPLLGKEIKSSSELANIAKQLASDDTNMSVAFFVTGGHRPAVQGIMEVDNRFLGKSPEEFANFLRNRSIDYGGARVFLSMNGTYEAGNVERLIREGLITDAIDAKKTRVSLRDSGIAPKVSSGDIWMGKHVRDTAQKVDAIKRTRDPNIFKMVPDKEAIAKREIILDKARGILEGYDLPTGKIGAVDRTPFMPDAMGDTAAGPKPLADLVTPGQGPVDVPVKRSDIVRMIDEQLDVPVRTGRFRQRAYGIYKTKPEVIRLKTANDIDTLAHEVGHHLDKKLGLGGISGLAKHPGSELFDSELLTLGQKVSRSTYSMKQIRAEGVAEFMRYYLLNPDQAKELAPNYFNAFEAKIAGTGVENILFDVSKQINDYVAQSPVQRVLSQISMDKPPGSRVTMDKLYTMAFDDLHPLKQAVEDMTGGVELPMSKDPYILARLNRGWVGRAEAYLHYGVIDDSFNKVGKSLEEVLNPVLDNLDDFRAYSVAKRAVELSGRGIESGIALDDALATIKTLESPKFDNSFKGLVKFQDSVLKQLVETGVLSVDDMATIRALNQNYVPFYRMFDTATTGGTGKQTFANLSSPIKGIKGSTREIVDPIESVIKNTYAITNVAERNRVAKTLIELAESTEGAGRWAEKVATPMFGSRFQLEQIASTLKSAGVDVNTVDLDHVATIFKPSIFTGGQDNIVSIFRNGKREFWQLQPDLYRSMMSMDKQSSNLIVKILSKPASMLRVGATINPEFMARNPIRDAWTAYVYSTYGFIPGVDTARGLFHVLKSDDLYWKWKASGGSHSALVSLDRNYLQGSIRKFAEQGFGDKALNILKHPIDALAALSEFGEEATRVSEFRKGVMAEGMSREGIIRAAFSSGEVTLDFRRGGYASKEINKAVAFFNAALQGTDKLARQFKEKPMQSLTRSLVSVTLPSVILYYNNHNNPKYQELPQWQKDFFWIIPVKDKMYRVPKPFEVGMIFGTLVERMLEFAKTHDRKAFEQYGKNLWEAGGPDYMPTALLPIIEAWANKSYFKGTPLVPQSEERLPAYMQYGPYTSETAKLLGRAFDASPRILDNTLRGYTAGLGEHAIKGLDQLLVRTGAVEPTTKPSTYEPEYPVIKAFQAKIHGQPKSVDDFYTELDKLESKYSAMRKKLDLPSSMTINLEELIPIAGMQDIGMTQEDVAKLIVYRKVRSEMTKLRNLRADVERNKNLTPSQKREAVTNIEQRMVDIARMLQGRTPMGGFASVNER